MASDYTAAMTGSTYSYQYQALRRGEIRILTLQPHWDPTAQIICSLSSTLLSRGNGPAPYCEALSYEWGGPIITTVALVDGKDFQMRANLAAALCCMRDTKKTRQLWVDAICIDQTDHAERNTQVALMGDIY